ncbi:hypothetical protein [Gillisia limnaea]|uniref:Dihydroorotase n=1 Tax=Gillisia limnaea (strain DSM 15749 / LMG 21470 / R-8282) TaxID=865937 RepID=H2BVR0_GILLR|nr:hypothetical protein [Gillisia limnaea]EHQ04016.1 hypothetical protein Gilli_3416 [Gillisia limnaea DSM 15749]
MKNVFILLILLLMSNISFSQDKRENLKPGDILSINKDFNIPFNHLYFPKTNFIIKRGAIANYKSMDGMKVKIVEISEDATVKLTPLNGRRFFNRFSYVKADLEKALESNELKQLIINNES